MVCAQESNIETKKIQKQKKYRQLGFELRYRTTTRLRLIP